jgi:uncharacterized protein YigE (DUF2233 family)
MTGFLKLQLSEISLVARPTGDLIGVMKHWLTIFLGFAGLTCASAQWTPGPLVELGKLPGGAVAWEREVVGGSRTIRLSGVSFHARESTFRVVDNPPEGRRSLTAILADAGAVAAVNGVYFHPDFKPLGLVVTEGKTVHEFERAKLLSGVLSVQGSRVELRRADVFKSASNLREALQAGPWLVEDGAVLSGLNTVKPARRTVVATDGRDNWALVVTSPLTLAETAEVLTLSELLGGWTVRDALNLDGGSSTALLAISGGRPVIDIPSFGAVRNYLAIVPRQR